MRSRPTVPTRNHNQSRRPRGVRRVLLALCVLALGISPTARAAVQTGPPPGLPGPPPGANSGLPIAPAAGIVPPAGVVGPPATLPARVSGPALLSGIVRVHGLRLTLAIACKTGGRVSVTAAAIRPGVLARARYACRNRRASAQLSLRRADARRLAALGPTPAGVTLGQGTAAQLSLTLQTTAQGPSYWSDGGLECSLLGTDRPYLVAPNFTLTPPAVIDVRPWVAWYTPTNGWRWLGTAGVNTSTWYRWTATSSGVQQWKTPAGAINPWTWAPISVHPGQKTYAIGVFEIVYWYAHPHYVWRYALSSPGANVLTTYCNYP